MKKIISLLFVVILLLSFGACSKNKSTNDTNTTVSTNEITTTEVSENETNTTELSTMNEDEMFHYEDLDLRLDDYPIIIDQTKLGDLLNNTGFSLFRVRDISTDEWVKYDESITINLTLEIVIEKDDRMLEVRLLNDNRENPEGKLENATIDSISDYGVGTAYQIFNTSTVDSNNNLINYSNGLSLNGIKLKDKPTLSEIKNIFVLPDNYCSVNKSATEQNYLFEINQFPDSDWINVIIDCDKDLGIDQITVYNHH